MTEGQVPQTLRPCQLHVRNHQRDCRLKTVEYKAAFQFHLETQLGLSRYEIAVHLVSPTRMARINQEHLNHEGPTDIITFSYREKPMKDLHGDLVICPAVAKAQASQFGTSWESELLRYFIHGILHLQGYDDQLGHDRRIMKREENRRLRALLTHMPIKRDGLQRQHTGAT